MFEKYRSFLPVSIRIFRKETGRIVSYAQVNQFSTDIPAEAHVKTVHSHYRRWYNDVEVKMNVRSMRECLDMLRVAVALSCGKEYKYYRTGCGRDHRLKELWGSEAGH